MSKRKAKTLAEGHSEVDAVASEIAQFIRERITKFRKSVDHAHEDEMFPTYLRDIAVRTMLIVRRADDDLREFTDLLFAVEDDVTSAEKAFGALYEANIDRWLKMPQ